MSKIEIKKLRQLAESSEALEAIQAQIGKHGFTYCDTTTTEGVFLKMYRAFPDDKKNALATDLLEKLEECVADQKEELKKELRL